MQADAGLIYCPPNWQETLQLCKIIEDNNKKMALESHPDEKVLADMANLAYTDCKGKLNLPKGWQLLTTARNKSWGNGYFGCAFWNPSEQQIALAHRGTDPLNLGALWVDGKGVYCNSYTDHMSSGVTFADTIKEGILKTNKKQGRRIVLSFTGHSLGAWMAGVTTLTVKLLKRVGKDFLRVASPQEGLHAHTLALDSPGVKDMLVKIQRDYDERYNRSICIQQLDITIILATPNPVNCTGFHVGDVYQLENVNTHSIVNFIKAFDKGNKKLAVQNWPEGLVEREGYDALKMYMLHLKDLKDPPASSSGSDQTTQPLEENVGSADTEDIQIPWKYRTKPWLGNICHLGVFSVEELNFISNWSLFQSNTIMKLTEIEKFADKQKLKKLDVPPFEIHTNRNTITCKTPKHLKKVIGLTKQLLRWFPKEIMQAVTKQNKSIKGAPLYMAGRAYLRTLPDILDCEDTLGLESFLESSERILQIETDDPKFEAARLNNILRQIENSSLDAKYLKANCQIFLCLKDYVSIKCLNKSDVTIDNLLVLQFSSPDDNLHPNYDVLKGILKNLEMCSHKKLVIILSHPIDWQNLTNLKLTIVTKPRKVFKLSDLTPTSRDYIFARDAIAIGEETLSLSILLGYDCKSNDQQILNKINILLSPILKKLATDPQFKSKIESKLPKLHQLDSLFSKGTKVVEKTKIVALLQRNWDDGPLLVISDPDQLGQDYWGQVAGAVPGRIYTSEEDGQGLFLEMCGKEPARDIYWLDLSAERLTLKEVYKRSLYIPRKFKTGFIINSMDKFIRYNGNRDIFIFIDAEDKPTLISAFKLSEEAKELFVSKDHFKIQIRSHELNIGSLNDEESINKHFFKMLEFEGSPHLVWQYSHGSLDGLRPFITRDYSDPIAEDVFSNTRKKLTIIADDPGMGKTTILTRISELIRDSWILRIDHNYLTAIDNLPSKLTLQSVTKCLIHASGLSPDDGLLSSLLKHCLEENSSRQVCILVDALDEITKENTKVKMLQLLKYLKSSTNCKTVVTSRVYPQEWLENELSEFSVQLDKITETEQEDYMMNSWLPHLDLELPEHGVSELEKEKLRKFARELREEVKGVLRQDVASLMGIPLQIRMLAEVFLQKAIQSVVSPEQEQNLCKITNLFELYNQFIEVKKSIYFEQKSIFNKVPDSYINDMVTKIMENHCVLAFKSLDPKFAEEYFTNTIISDQQLKDISGLGLIRANIGGTIPFIHRTFEEYFCADFVVKWLRQESQGRSAKEHIKLVKDELCIFLLRPEYYIIRQFVESQLNTSPIPSNVLENNLIFYLHWSKNRQLFFHDRVKTPLHVAADEQNRGTLAFLLSGPSDKTSEEDYISLMAARDKAGKTALNIALENRNRDIIKQITENMESCSYESLLKLMLANFVDFEGDRDHNLFSEYSPNTQQSNNLKKALMRTEQIRKQISPFIAAVKEDDYSAVQKILDGMESDIERSHLLIAIDSQGDTAINLVASKKDNMLFKLFAKQGVCMSYDKREQNPLHCAAKSGHISTVSFLLNQSKETYDSIKTIKDDNLYGEEAIAFPHTEMYKMFSSIKTKDGSTALLSAAQGGHYDMVKKLAAIGADIHSKNNDDWTALIQAARNGHLEVVELLLMNGADLNCQNVDGDSALFCAAKNGHLATVRTLLEKEADIHTVSNDGWTALMQAVNGGHLEVVELLLSNGADFLPELNSRNKNGFSALLDAVLKGHYDIVCKLLEKGADIRIRDINGRTALMLAASEGHLEVVELLLLNEAVLNSQDEDGYSALMAAVRNGHLATVHSLLEKGADIHAINNNDWTALMIAASKGHLEVLELLLMNGADLNFQNAAGDSALSCATNNSRLTTVCSLLEKGADIPTRNKEDWTELQKAVNMGCFEVINNLLNSTNLYSELKIDSEDGFSALTEYIKSNMLEKVYIRQMGLFKKLLMKNKRRMETSELRSNTADLIPELNSREANGFSTFLDMALKGQHDTVRTLLEKGADIQMKNINGRTALMIAASKGHLEVIELLLLNGADINYQDQFGFSALLDAVFNGHLDTVRTLLEKGADIQRRNNNDRTALMLAASNGYLEIVELLLLNGADFNYQNEDGDSALLGAVNGGHLATVSTLLEKGADIHIRNNKGSTALMLAASEGNLEVIELLLLNGADLNSQNKASYSALLLAVQNNHLDTVCTLLEKGADIHIRNNFGRTALMLAAKEGLKELEIVEFLLLNGADLNSQDVDGHSALLLAVLNNHLATACTLLEKGADIHIKNNKGWTALILAACEGHLEVVELLLLNGADLNSQDEDGYSALLLAVFDNHLATACTLLEKGADIHIRNNKGSNALMLAAEKGHLEVVELLLLNGADLNSQNEYGYSALLLAVYFDHLATVCTLLEKGADIHMWNNEGMNALMLAAREGDFEVVELLLLNGADLNSQKEDGYSALLLAVLNNHLATACTLLEKGADIHIRINEGWTALMIAASKGHLEVVELLLLNGADLYSQDEDGYSALLHGVFNNHLATVRSLLEKGADIHVRFNKGWTALMLAANKGHLEVVEFLLLNGADLNSQDEYGSSALKGAALNGHLAVVCKLLEKGADIHTRDNIGWTALNCAAGYGHLDVANLLLLNGADLNSRDEDGDTAFLQAAANGHTEIVVLLLQRGVDVNSQRDDGRTALSWAALKGHKNVVEVLLQHNADVSCQDKDGKTALSWAVEKAHGEVVDLLRSHQEADPLVQVCSLISVPPSSDNSL